MCKKICFKKILFYIICAATSINFLSKNTLCMENNSSENTDKKDNIMQKILPDIKATQEANLRELNKLNQIYFEAKELSEKLNFEVINLKDGSQCLKITLKKDLLPKEDNEKNKSYDNKEYVKQLLKKLNTYREILWENPDSEALLDVEYNEIRPFKECLCKNVNLNSRKNFENLLLNTPHVKNLNEINYLGLFTGSLLPDLKILLELINNNKKIKTIHLIDLYYEELIKNQKMLPITMDSFKDIEYIRPDKSKWVNKIEYQIKQKSNDITVSFLPIKFLLLLSKAQPENPIEIIVHSRVNTYFNICEKNDSYKTDITTIIDANGNPMKNPMEFIFGQTKDIINFFDLYKNINNGGIFSALHENTTSFIPKDHFLSHIIFDNNLITEENPRDIIISENIYQIKTFYDKKTGQKVVPLKMVTIEPEFKKIKAFYCQETEEIKIFDPLLWLPKIIDYKKQFNQEIILSIQQIRIPNSYFKKPIISIFSVSRIDGKEYKTFEKSFNLTDGKPSGMDGYIIDLIKQQATAKNNQLQIQPKVQKNTN